jgi:hypothetical protein
MSYNLLCIPNAIQTVHIVFSQLYTKIDFTKTDSCCLKAYGLRRSSTVFQRNSLPDDTFTKIKPSGDFGRVIRSVPVFKNSYPLNLIGHKDKIVSVSG